jgi:hypothetical protein
MLNTEQAEVLGLFMDMLKAPTGDGGVKRALGQKVCWKDDTSHEAAIFSHLNKWKHGERRDATSGAHPLVHLAWRALAIAWQESQTVPEPIVQTIPKQVIEQFQHARFDPSDPRLLPVYRDVISSDQDDIADALSAIAFAGKTEAERRADSLEQQRMVADAKYRDTHPVEHPDPEGLRAARARNRILD